jgi:hypothetical protein
MYWNNDKFDVKEEKEKYIVLIAHEELDALSIDMPTIYCEYIMKLSYHIIMKGISYQC